MSIELTLRQKALVLIGVPLFFQIAFIGTLLFALTTSEREAKEVEHAKKVLGLGESVTNSLVRSIKGVGIYTATGESALIGNMDQELDRAAESMNELNKTLQNRKDLKDKVTHAAQTADLVIAITRESKRSMDIGDNERGQQYFRRLKGAAEQCYLALNDVTEPFAKEKRLALDTGDHFREFLRPALAVVFVSNVVIAVWLVVFFNRSTASRLSVLMDNAQKLQESQALNPPITGADELAVLDGAFQNAARSIKAANEMKRQFFAMVSHDIRTPITSINISLELFEMGAMGELSEHAIGRISRDRENCKNLLTLINDLLDYEKIEAGQFELEQGLVTVEELFNRAHATVFALSEKKEIAIELDSGNLHVFADADRISQVLINLLSNALKFSESGQKIFLRAKPCENQQVEISVTDQGRGIPADALSQIFSPFKQVTAKDAKKGTGLGLTICKSIVESHGGNIGVTSEEGKGTTFWFRLRATAT